MNKFKKALPWLLLVFLMIIIFYLSNQPLGQSRELTKTTMIMVADVVEKFIPIDAFKTHGIVRLFRKSAHFFLYLVMALILMFGFKSFGIKGRKSIVLTMLICIVFAVSDEIHQLFVDGRGAQAKDVIIDAFGAMAGIGIYKLFGSWRTRSKDKRKDRKNSEELTDII